MWSPKNHLERWISSEPGGARELMPWSLEKPGNPSAYSHPFPRSSAPSPYSWGSDDHSSASPLYGKRNLLHTSLKICKQWRLAHAGDIRDAGSIPGLGIPPEEGMATHSSIFAWRIPIDRGAWWAIVQGSHRVGHDWSYLTHMLRVLAAWCLVCQATYLALHGEDVKLTWPLLSVSASFLTMSVASACFWDVLYQVTAVLPSGEHSSSIYGAKEVISLVLKSGRHQRHTVRFLDIGAASWCSVPQSELWLSFQKLSHDWLFATPWTVAPQAPVSMGFPR